MYGVELDTVSAGIAQQLYQKSSIAAQGFEEVNVPDSFFDGVIGNVPFGGFKVSDKRYDKNNFLIHDYFFAKSLDKLRPGGVMALVTSKGTMDNYGCPYVQENCDTEQPSDNIVIYGHNMNDGSMFSALTKYKSKDFWESHKYIAFDTLTDKQNYEVIAAFKTVVYTDNADSFKYYQFVNAETAEEFNAYIGKCKELSLYDTELNAEYGDKLITLSTCEYSRTNGRFVVVARLVKE